MVLAWVSFEFLRRVVFFLDIYSLILLCSMLDLIMLICGVICVVLLTMKLICVHIMHAMINLTLHHPCLTQFIPSFTSLHGARMGEPFGVVATFSVAEAYFELEDTLNEVYDLDGTPLEGVA